MTRAAVVLALLALSLSSAGAHAQHIGAPEAHPELEPAGMRNEGFGTVVEPDTHNSRNVSLLSHLPLGSPFTVADIEVEQEITRPFAYVARMNGTDASAGVTILNLKDPADARVLHTWAYPNAAALKGMGALDVKYFKLDRRYYLAVAVRWNAGTADGDVGAVILDVTGLPDARTVREVARIRDPRAPGGFENVFAYRHSDGRALLFVTTNGPRVDVYDLRKVVAGEAGARAGSVALPDAGPLQQAGRFHDVHAAFEASSQQDRLYAGGTGGYFVFDVSAPDAPKLLVRVSALGVPAGGALAPAPDGRTLIGQTEYQYAPLRLFDLRPGFESGEVTRPVGGWTANWENVAHGIELRWPFAFVASYEDGLQILNVRDPTRPRTIGFLHTYDGPHNRGWGGVEDPLGGNNVFNGAFGVDVRNTDGLIVVSDMQSGFWAVKLEGFNGWNGTNWGMPNVSSAQDWDNGPDNVVPRRPVL